MLPQFRALAAASYKEEVDAPKPLVRRRGKDVLRDLGKKPSRMVVKNACSAKGAEGARVLGIVSCVNTYWKEVAYHTSVLVDVCSIAAPGNAFGMIAMKRRKQLSAVSFKPEMEELMAKAN